MNQSDYWQTFVYIPGRGPLTASLPDDDCWLWCSIISDFGFPMFANRGGKQQHAARHIAEIIGVTIPDGLTTCETDARCVNPLHQVVTAKRPKPNPFDQPPAACGHVPQITGELVRFSTSGRAVRDCAACTEDYWISAAITAKARDAQQPQ